MAPVACCQKYRLPIICPQRENFCWDVQHSRRTVCSFNTCIAHKSLTNTWKWGQVSIMLISEYKICIRFLRVLKNADCQMYFTDYKKLHCATDGSDWCVAGCVAHGSASCKTCRAPPHAQTTGMTGKWRIWSINCTGRIPSYKDRFFKRFQIHFVHWWYRSAFLSDFFMDAFSRAECVFPEKNASKDVKTYAWRERCPWISKIFIHKQVFMPIFPLAMSILNQTKWNICTTNVPQKCFCLFVSLESNFKAMRYMSRTETASLLLSQKLT